MRIVNYGSITLPVTARLGDGLPVATVCTHINTTHNVTERRHLVKLPEFKSGEVIRCSVCGQFLQLNYYPYCCRPGKNDSQFGFLVE